MWLPIFAVISLMVLNNASADSGADMERSYEYLFDFTDNSTTLDGWREVSDTKREVGMSKATLTLQKTQVFNRAVFFAVLNPQPNGACFAGVVNDGKYDFTNFNYITLNARAQGEYRNYKIVLRHKGQNGEPYPSYEHFFSAPSDGQFQTTVLALKNFDAYYRGALVPDAEPLDRTNITSVGIQVYGGVYEAPSDGEFKITSLALKNFDAYYRGKKVPDAEPLDKANITSIGIQVYGGVYEAIKYKGVTALELNWIKVQKSQE